MKRGEVKTSRSLLASLLLWLSLLLGTLAHRKRVQLRENLRNVTSQLALRIGLGRTNE